MRYAAFIMTFERPQLVVENINCLLKQTLAPEHILIVDNSASTLTQEAISNLGNDKIQYHRVGYNSGPAGASAIGLQILTALGFEWIYWGDDDDPPPFDDTIERILQIPKKIPNEKIGLLGFRGCNFNLTSFKMEKILNKDYKAITEVFCISGGASMIVNAEVVKQGILPDENLFFGFEELDYAISVKNKGFKNFITGDISLQIRKSRNTGFKKDNRIKLKPAKDYESLWRDYDSYRNLIIIAFHKESNYTALFFIIFRGLSRALFGFFQGFNYGLKNFKIVTLGIIHGLTNKSGFTIKKDT